MKLIFSRYERKEIPCLNRSRVFPAGATINVLLFLLFFAWVLSGDGISQTPAEEEVAPSSTGEKSQEAAPQEEKTPDQKNDVTYSDGRLSVDFKKVPAGEALARIGQAAGFEVVTDEALKNKPLSIRFSDEPLEKGVTRIIRRLDTKNYRYSFTDKGALETVVVRASSEPLPAQTNTVPTAGTQIRTVGQSPSGGQGSTVIRNLATSTQGDPTSNRPGRTVRRPNTVRRILGPDGREVGPRQGYMQNWATPAGIPANPEDR